MVSTLGPASFGGGLLVDLVVAEPWSLQSTGTGYGSRGEPSLTGILAARATLGNHVAPGSLSSRRPPQELQQLGLRAYAELLEDNAEVVAHCALAQKDLTSDGLYPFATQ